MKRLAIAAAGVALLLSQGAHAVVCTGTTQTLADGGVATGAFLLTPGNCVEAGDKLFGSFAVGGAITGNGAASFNFISNPGNVTIGFLGSVGPNTSGSVTYTVGVDQTIAPGWMIDALQKDFSLNGADTAAFASATLTGSTTADASIAFDCTRTVNPQTSNCPQTGNFAPVLEMTVSQLITTHANAVVPELTDTIGQIAPVPAREPGSLALIGSALIGMVWLVRRRGSPVAG